VSACLGFSAADALDHLGRCRLGDRRRTDRLVDLARRIHHHPAGSLPQKLHEPAAYRACCRLMNQSPVTHAAVLGPHALATVEAARHGPPVVLFVHDTTELDYSGQQTLALGPIGNGGGRGYECHHSLAVDPERRCLLGLAHQILHTRARPPADEGVAAKRGRADRESRLWVRAVQAIGPAPADRLWVDVCDRGADTFEFLEYEVRHGRSFVIRSTHNRAVAVDDGPHLLHDWLRTLPAQVHWSVTVSANKGQPARTATVQACWGAVRVRPPHVRRGDHGREPLTVWALRVWEADPPAGVKEPLEWVLLTDLPIDGETAARRRVGWYECRPVVEELHKAQKSGLGIEALQLQSQAGLQPLIALLSVLAVALVNAREAARQPETAARPAAEYVDPLWVAVLSVWRYGAARTLTVTEFVLAVARLGGHQNRKCDGLPGWQTLWRGVGLLHAMVEYEQSRARCGKL
jgi:hypothetical protein